MHTRLTACTASVWRKCGQAQNGENNLVRLEPESLNSCHGHYYCLCYKRMASLAPLRQQKQKQCDARFLSHVKLGGGERQQNKTKHSDMVARHAFKFNQHLGNNGTGFCLEIAYCTQEGPIILGEMTTSHAGVRSKSANSLGKSMTNTFFFFTLIKKILPKHKEPNSSSIRFANQNGMSSDHKRANRCYFLPELVLQKLNKKERRMRLVRTASS